MGGMLTHRLVSGLLLEGENLGCCLRVAHRGIFSLERLDLEL